MGDTRPGDTEAVADCVDKDGKLWDWNDGDGWFDRDDCNICRCNKDGSAECTHADCSQSPLAEEVET